MMCFKQTTGLAIVLGVTGFASVVQAASFTQPNAVSQAQLQAMSAQAAAGKAASMVNIAAPVTMQLAAAHPPAGPQPTVVSTAYMQSLAAQAAAGKTASLVNIAAPAYGQMLAAQAAAGKTASLTTIAAPAHVQSIIAQAAAGKTASLVTMAPPSAVAQNAPFVPKGVLKPPPGYGSNYYTNPANGVPTYADENSFVNGLYTLGVATVGAAGAKVVMTLAGAGGSGSVTAIQPVGPLTEVEGTGVVTEVGTGTTVAGTAAGTGETLELSIEAAALLGL